MKTINLSDFPEMKGFTVLKSIEEFSNFLENPPEKFFSERDNDQKRKNSLLEELDYWLKLSNENLTTFFAIYDEENDITVNDGFGSYHIFKCVLLTEINGKVNLFKNLICEITH